MERLKGQSYIAPPIKRVWIDKEGGKKRPIGLLEIEDKIVQKAVAMLMGAVYEQDFYPFSYGFREAHSAHRLVIGFQHEDDARRVIEVLPKRFAKYGLEIHPEKSRLLSFGKPANRPDITRSTSAQGCAILIACSNLLITHASAFPNSAGAE